MWDPSNDKNEMKNENYFTIQLIFVSIYYLTVLFDIIYRFIVPFQLIFSFYLQYF